MNEIRKTSAEWRVELSVYCPYCDEYKSDILNDIDDSFEKLGKWVSSEKNLHVECICEDCGKEFIITETEY